MIVADATKTFIELVITPLFLSSSTYSFLEAIFQDISLFLCHDIRLADKNGDYDPKVIEHQAKQMITSVTNNLKILPIIHLNLLALLQQNKWTQQDIFTFMFKNMIIPQMRVMLNSSQ